MKRTWETEHTVITINDIPVELVSKILRFLLMRAVNRAIPSPQNFVKFIKTSFVCKTWETLTDFLWQDAFDAFRWHEENLANIFHSKEEKKYAEKNHPKYWKYQFLHGISRRTLLYEALPSNSPILHCEFLDEFPHKIPNSLRDAICVSYVEGIIHKDPKFWNIVDDTTQFDDFVVPPLPTNLESTIPISDNFMEISPTDFLEEEEEENIGENKSDDDFDPKIDEDSTDFLCEILEDVKNPETKYDYSTENPGGTVWDFGENAYPELFFISEKCEEFSFFLFDEIRDCLFDSRENLPEYNSLHPDNPLEKIPGFQLIKEISQDYKLDVIFTKPSFYLLNFVSSEYILQIWTMAEKMTEENLGPENLCEISRYNNDGCDCESSSECEEENSKEKGQKEIGNSEKENFEKKEKNRKKILFQKTFKKNIDLAIKQIEEENYKKQILWGKYDMSDKILHEITPEKRSKFPDECFAMHKHNHFFVWKFQRKLSETSPQFLELEESPVFS